MDRAKCFAFYSYKGGSGRSTTCINTVLHLIDLMGADPKHPILLVDTDLESAGLTYYFKCNKKFSSKFSSAIHAASLLKVGIPSVSQKWVFGGEDSAAPCDPSALSDIVNELSAAGLDQAAQAFDGLTVYKPERDILNRIVNAFVSQRQASTAGGSLLESFPDLKDKENKDILKYYDIKKILNDLLASKDEKKRDVLEKALPATKFVDISSYFGKDPGTVRFLGVDVKFNGEQVVRNDAINYIREICLTAGEYGYKAVIFDSSAGVQSTAHALQQEADVIVCCLRPSTQFLLGTKEIIEDYREILSRKSRDFSEETRMLNGNETSDTVKKPIILLPTVVPMADTYSALKQRNFEQIRDIFGAKIYQNLIDTHFCTVDTALNEIEIFKWREMILGVEDMNKGKCSDDIAREIDSVSTPEKIEDREDTKRAVEIFKELAAHIVQNS